MEISTDLKNWRYGQEEDLCRVHVYFKERGNKLEHLTGKALILA